MKVIDFDAHFYEYARKWIAVHPGLNEDEIDDSYNDMMAEWISQPQDWLDGDTPECYFDRFETSGELLELMKAYSRASVNMPEPLYTRIVTLGELCEEGLKEIAGDETEDESLRAEAIGLLRDIGSRCADDILVEMVTGAEDKNELSEMAADILRTRESSYATRLLDAYLEASTYAEELILDIACELRGDERIFEYLAQWLEDYPERYALTASLLGKLGDERAIEPLKKILDTEEIGYFDYIELRAAIEALGGDAGEERNFEGDRDYEVLKDLDGR